MENGKWRMENGKLTTYADALVVGSKLKVENVMGRLCQCFGVWIKLKMNVY